MATFYPSIGNQRDILQTPYSGDQKLASFPESLGQSSDMMMYLNQPSSSGSYMMMLPSSSLPADDSVEIIPSVGGRNEMMFIPPTSETTSYRQLNTPTAGLVGTSISGDPQVVPGARLGILDGERNFQSQGLSLSLGTQMPSAVSVPLPSFHYQYMNSAFPGTLSCEGDGSDKSKELRGSGSFLSNLAGSNHSAIKAESWNPHMHLGINQYEPADFSDTILNSKYLKETQQLLNEVVNVQKALKQFDSSKRQNVHGTGLDASKETDGKSSNQSMLTTTNGTASNATESNTNGSTEISPSERQDLQNKKTKLLAMLDEVDKRYRQYYHQMQIVVSSLDSIAGCGAAKPYTTLARKTISRHFRSLRDAISGQIQAIKKSLGEQETGIPRLRSVDYHIRQQRAMQHLGVMRHAWRPQRGLPESSVSTLRAWLFEHFLHPYPNDSEKIMLARQTGLSRNQVANWFINARVRLWKPMVEEMYKEEFGDSELNSKSLENASKMPRDNCSASEDGGEELQDSTTSTAIDSTAQPGKFHESKSDHIPSVEINGSSTRMVSQSGFYQGNIIHSGAIQLQDDQRPMMKDHSLLAATATNDMSELNGFGFGDQVSLALGLHQRETDAYPMSDGIHIGGDDTMSSVGPGTADYHCVDTGKQQHRFGTPHQLHDFVV